ncbi:MAG: (2Fe-2S)-binding protein [Paenisporosarcina sp.]
MEYPIQQDMLAKFRWLDSVSQVARSITIKDFFDETKREEHLTWMMTHCGSPNKGHAASITVKRIGYLAAIYVYVKHTHQVESSFLEGTMHTIQDETSSTGWVPMYSFPLMSSSNEKLLDEWVTKDLYAKYLVPLVALLSEEKGISQTTLFENIHTYMKWMFINKLGIKEEYQKLLTNPISKFGDLLHHPLSRFDCGDDALRKTCCLFYQTDGANKPCEKCPLTKKYHLENVSL